MKFKFIAILFLGFWLSIPAATACSCFPPDADTERGIKAWLAEKGVVVVGEVLSSELQRGTFGGEEIHYQVRVTEHWLGEDASIKMSEVVTLATPAESTMCGARFARNTPYLIYAFPISDGDLLATNICTRTRRMERAKEDLAVLRGIAK
ncbi:MAG: hypothetical protein JJU10_02865 [Idiomarina sp.]|nr:hypothetical protein [Idiomarina sp.]